MKKQKKPDKPTIAEGLNTEDELLTDATAEEISKGEYTEVTDTFFRRKRSKLMDSGYYSHSIFLKEQS